METQSREKEREKEVLRKRPSNIAQSLNEAFRRKELDLGHSRRTVDTYMSIKFYFRYYTVAIKLAIAQY